MSPFFMLLKHYTDFIKSFLFVCFDLSKKQIDWSFLRQLETTPPISSKEAEISKNSIDLKPKEVDPIFLSLEHLGYFIYARSL